MSCGCKIAATRGVKVQICDGAFGMGLVYFYSAILIAVGSCEVIRQQFMPFVGMILIGVGLVLPVQIITLRWLQKKTNERNH